MQRTRSKVFYKFKFSSICRCCRFSLSDLTCKVILTNSKTHWSNLGCLEYGIKNVEALANHLLELGSQDELRDQYLEWKSLPFTSNLFSEIDKLSKLPHPFCLLGELVKSLKHDITYFVPQKKHGWNVRLEGTDRFPYHKKIGANFILDDSGQTIWNLCDGKNSIEDVQTLPMQ